MDYAFDFYLNVGTNEEFIYDDHRYFSKLYVILKLIGFITYTITLSGCENPEFYTVMMTAILNTNTIKNSELNFHLFMILRFGIIVYGLNLVLYFLLLNTE
jgi:hypothetical protein